MASDHDLLKARSLQLELRLIFESRDIAAPDQPALRRVQELCDAVNRTVPDTLCQMKLRRLRRCAREFFIKGPNNGEDHRGKALAALDDLEMRLYQIEVHREARRIAAAARLLQAQRQNLR